jgi:hypothetical protein
MWGGSGSALAWGKRRNERGTREQRPTTARPWHARAARHCLNRGVPGASDTWALAGSRRERERRATGRVGRPGEKGNGPSLKE